MKVHGRVQLLHCRDCGADQASWVFSGDTDMATQGLCSAGMIGGAELVLGFEPIASTGADVRTAQFAHGEARMANGRGVKFATYLERYAAPDIVYTCPWCTVGQMEVGRVLTASEYRAEGGKLTCLDGLEVQETVQ